LNTIELVEGKSRADCMGLRSKERQQKGLEFKVSD
jgi:hypothetical protein